MLSIKPVLIMGATGMGKTKLSIDISKAIGGEVMNANKMQIYACLDIATNKIHPVFLITYLRFFHQLQMTCLYLPFDLWQQVLWSLLQDGAGFQF